MNKSRGRVNQGICPCGNLQTAAGKNRFGETVYRAICSTCKTKGRRTKKDHCENCGFVALHPVQLDVDHKDANGANNDPDNLWTLCANCHRLKTHVNKDWKPKND